MRVLLIALLAAISYAQTAGTDFVWDFYYGYAIHLDSTYCEGSSSLEYESLDDCSNTCFDCSGCVAYVDNREENPPRCVFKSNIRNLYERSDASKDVYILTNTLITTTAAPEEVRGGYHFQRDRR